MTTTPSNLPHVAADHVADNRSSDPIECLYERIAGTLAESNVCGWELDLSSGVVFRTSLPSALGYQPNEVESTSDAWAALVHPDDLAAARRRLDDLVHARGGVRTVELEYRVRARDGSWRWMLDRAQVTRRNSDGVVTRLAGVGIDITDYKSAQSETERHERRYLDLVRRTRVIGWEYDRATRRFTWVSPNASEVLGFSPDEWRQPGFWASRLHPDDREAAITFARARTDEGLDHDFEYRMIAQDGRVLWMRDLSTVMFDGGKPTRLCGVFIDITERRRAEDAQRESTEHLRAIAEHIPGAVFMYDYRAGEPRRLIYLGPGLEEIIGPSRAAAVRQRYDVIFDFLHPDDRRALKVAADRSTETGEKLDVEMRFIHEDGSPRWVRSLAQPTRRPDGFERWHGVMIDITGRKEAERSLRERERMIDTLLGNLPGIAYRCRNEPDWPVDFMSDGCQELLGYSPADFIDGRVSYGRDVIHPDDRGNVWDDVQEAIREQQPFQLVYRVRDSRGSVRWVWEQGQAVASPNGGIEAIEGFIIDVIERQEAEDRLRDREARLRLLVNQVPAVMWTTDIDLRFTSNTGAGLASLGISPNQLVGTSAVEYFAGTAGAAHMVDRHLAALAGHGSADEHHWSGRVFHTRLEPLRDGTGGIAGVVGVAHDVTDRRRTEDELRRTNAHVKLLLSELDHRVRNNLSSLVTLIDFTRRSTTDVNRFAETITGRVRTMAIMHSMLSRSSGSNVSLRRLIHSIVPPDHRAAVLWDGPDVMLPPRPTESLPMIVHELVTNSLKYGALTSPSGRINVICETSDEPDQSRLVTLWWRESGGPPIEHTPSAGVGTTLIKGLATADLRGEVELTYPREGAVHRLRFTVPPPNSATDVQLGLTTLDQAIDRPHHPA